MDTQNLRFPGAILASMLLALVIMLIPLSETLSPWRPEWVVLTLIHWAIVAPRKITLTLAWATGLLVDTLNGNILGQHAFGFVIVIYFAIRFAERINPQIIWQQAFLILVVLGTYLLLNLWVLGVTGKTPDSWAYWLPLFSSIVIWPVWHHILKFFQVPKTAL